MHDLVIHKTKWIMTARDGMWQKTKDLDYFKGLIYTASQLESNRIDYAQTEPTVELRGIYWKLWLLLLVYVQCGRGEQEYFPRSAQAS